MLVTDASLGPVLPVASGSAAKLRAGEGADEENVDDAKYEAGKEEKETAGSAGVAARSGGAGAGAVTISDCRQASSIIAARATNAARAATRSNCFAPRCKRPKPVLPHANSSPATATAQNPDYPNPERDADLGLTTARPCQRATFLLGVTIWPQQS
jgi:hypothetical protein